MPPVDSETPARVESGRPGTNRCNLTCSAETERVSKSKSVALSVEQIVHVQRALPPDIIRYAIWLYFRLTLRFRDVEEMPAERDIDVSYEIARCWTIKFGPQIASNLKRRRQAPSPRWHLDETVVSIGGKRMRPWPAVDDEGRSSIWSFKRAGTPQER